MADFKNFLAQGLQAAQNAERRRTEVIQILADLDTQIYDATGKTVHIRVEEWDELGLNSLLKSNLARSTMLFKEAIFAVSARNEKTKEMLTIWEQGRDGYPCKITIGKTTYSCEDRAALEEALGQLLKDPIVGEKIHKLMKIR